MFLSNSRQGNVMDSASLQALMSGHDTVIVVFGVPLNWSTFTTVPDLC